MNKLLFFLTFLTLNSQINLYSMGQQKKSISKNDLGYSLFNECMFGTDIKKIQDLLDQGADINFQSKRGKTALMIAIGTPNYNLELIKFLIDIEGINLDIRSNDGATALITAIDKKNDEIAKLLINKGANLDIQDLYGRSPLILAIQLRNTYIASLLISSGANLNLKDNEGHDALQWAISQRNDRIISMITIQDKTNDHFCEIAQKLKEEFTEQLFDSESPSLEKLKILFDKYPLDVNTKKEYLGSKFVEAVEYEKDKLIKILIEQDINLNYQDEDGYTALMRAVENDNIEIVKILINKKVNLDLVDRYKYSALTIALDQEKEEIALLLIENGANLTIETNDKTTAITIAKKWKNAKIEKLINQKLFENAIKQLSLKPKQHNTDTKKSVNDKSLKKQNKQAPPLSKKLAKKVEKNKKQLTKKKNIELLIQYAKEDNEKEITELLESFPEIIDEKDSNGFTALMHACKQCSVDTVKALLKKNANTEITDSLNGHTAFTLAALEILNISKMIETNKNDAQLIQLLEYYKEIVKELCKAHANIEIQDKQGKTILEKAQSTGPEIYEFFKSLKKRTCAQCLEETDSLKLCGKCRKVGYCSELCQKNNWRAHKVICGQVISTDYEETVD